MIQKALRTIMILSAVLLTAQLFAQKDSLIFKNGNTVVGEIKSMDRGVLQIETPYSDSDFRIDIDGIKEVYTTSRFLLTTTDGTRYTGTFFTKDGKIVIKDEEKGEHTATLEEIVMVKGLDDSFLSRLYANVDVGYSLTKANNQQQLNANFRLGYMADFWSLDGYYNSLFSSQDNVANIRRNDGGVGYRYFLPHDWYLSADLNFLSNTEQLLNLRTNGKIGFGKYVIHTNAAYWGFSVGTAINNEEFGLQTTAEMPQDSVFKRNSFEGVIGTEVNLYDIGDLNLFTNLITYPSFTDSGRWRADFRFDAKYDNFLLEDFYIRAGFTLNYDNRPAEAGREVDYIFTTGFGWEW